MLVEASAKHQGYVHLLLPHRERGVGGDDKQWQRTGSGTEETQSRKSFSERGVNTHPDGI